MRTLSPDGDATKEQTWIAEVWVSKRSVRNVERENDVRDIAWYGFARKSDVEDALITTRALKSGNTYGCSSQIRYKTAVEYHLWREQ